ncbi:acyl-CoA-like ligand-binding transcription factor [Agrococcus carbonis]|uniref:DNA-binding transcriptional regulator, AcrR family n=1 Tax=Agrococcus carbonis TaxID=684552 RepID=A0A1H1S3E7_9MICO|nr:TetR family transcriptional regulator [Agrococcus carbonis]SDS42527.1 DNA-binding transcriptional regulator, AcrR family [Agrococcus carbonis]
MPETSTPDEHPRPGLRERKKALTHRTIADAAFDLTIEHGLEGVTIDQIADRAFVSPRTVSNYFTSKEAAIIAARNNAPVELLHGLEERPADETPLRSLRSVMTTAIRAWGKEQLEALKAKEELIMRYPALLPHRMAQYDELEDAIRIAIAERTGTDAETAPYPRLIAGAASTAVKTAIRVWDTTGGDAGAIADLVDEAFDELEAGLSPDVA